MRTTLAALILAAVATACSDKNPVSYSAPVGISLPVASKDVVSGAVSSEKNINTETGNPYGAFTSAARAQLGGAEPSHIAVTGVTLELGGISEASTARGVVGSFILELANLGLIDHLRSSHR